MLVDVIYRGMRAWECTHDKRDITSSAKLLFLRCDVVIASDIVGAC